MAKSRTANRGWRSRMQKHLADNPEAQAKVDELVKERLIKQVASLKAGQSDIASQITSLEGEIEALTPADSEATPEAVS